LKRTASSLLRSLFVKVFNTRCWRRDSSSIQITGPANVVGRKAVAQQQTARKDADIL
jgi:hypothetical protein